jgi:uncharacterized membrane-anchored protein YhcB (DUF1043 family)
MNEQLAIFAAAVVAFAIVGIVIGMLIAPRLQRLGDPDDEETGDRVD